MVNFNKCLWPATLSFSKISLAIKSCLKPSKNSKEWKYCEVKVLSKKLLTNFNEASKLTNKCLTQSSTEAESYLPKKMLKKRKKNIKKETWPVIMKIVQSPYKIAVSAAAIAMKVIQAFHYYQHFQVILKYIFLIISNHYYKCKDRIGMCTILY